MSTLAKYWDKYSKRGKPDSAAEAKQHMTDREAYISFLEVQLERVTQSVLVTQGFSDRIEQMQAQVNTVEDKIMNVTRLAKLQQNYVEGHDDELASLKVRIDTLAHDRPAQTIDLQTDSRLKRLEELILAREPAKPRDADETRSELRMIALLKDQKQRFDEELEKVQERFMGGLERLEESQNETLRRVDVKISEAINSISRGSTFPALSSQQMDDMEQLLHVLAEELKAMKSHMDTVDQDLTTALRRKLTASSDENQSERVSKIEGIVVATADKLKAMEGKLSVEIPDIEKVVAKKISKAVERMGELLKKYIEAQKAQHTTLADLSARVDRIDRVKATKASPGRARQHTSGSELGEDSESRRSKSVSEEPEAGRQRRRSSSRSLTPKSGRRKGDASPRQADASKTVKRPASKKAAKGERKSKLEKIYSHLTG